MPFPTTRPPHSQIAVEIGPDGQIEAHRPAPVETTVLDYNSDRWPRHGHPRAKRAMLGAEVKSAAANRWVAAVNADGQFGVWRYAIARKVADVNTILDECVQRQHAG